MANTAWQLAEQRMRSFRNASKAEILEALHVALLELYQTQLDEGASLWRDLDYAVPQTFLEGVD